jgi:hypothetical protein
MTDALDMELQRIVDEHCDGSEEALNRLRLLLQEVEKSAKRELIASVRYVLEKEHERIEESGLLGAT